MSFATVEVEDKVALVWLDQPDSKLNTISVELLDVFEALLDRLHHDESIEGAVLISRKPDCFIAGADIRQFLKLESAEAAADASRQGNRLLSRMASFPKPIVAAVNGSCLGGGLEVALACRYRIASDHPKTVMGLPEVKLGLLPGAGGSQRLPRLVGLQRALAILLTGKNVYPRQALRMGLVDEVIHPYGLLQAAHSAARELAGGGLKPRRRRRPAAERLLEGNRWGRRMIFKQARKRVERQTWGNYPAPPSILDVVSKGLRQGLEAGLEAESAAFGRLMQTPQSKQLINLFFAMTSDSKPDTSAARPVSEVAVLGAGLMGAGIAQVTAAKEVEVLLKDLDQQALSRGEKTIWKDLSGKVRKRAMTPFQRDRLLSRIRGVTDYERFAGSDIVIEAVFEDLGLKRRILAEVEEAVGPDAIFASNTSALPISQIAAQAKRPEQVVGMHYFSPVTKMPLLEIIATPQTADWVVSTAVDLGLKQGKTVIVVGDGPGFYTTRILAPLMNEALLMLEEGAAIPQLDRAMRRFGFPVGPATLMDEVGIDVGAHVSQTLGEAFAARGATPSKAMEQLAQKGFLGRKNKRGFYLYSKGKKGRKRGAKEVNRSIYDHFGGEPRKDFSDQEIQSRLSLVMINEAAYCLQEGILHSPRDGDLGAILGLGFPPFLGGPFRYLDSKGLQSVLGEMRQLESGHGPRFAAAPILQERAAQGRPFYR